MSFVAGFVTGMTAERSQGRSHLSQYMQREGLTIIDQRGRPVPLERIVKEGLKGEKRSWSKIVVVGAVLVVATAVTGGSAWVVLTII